MARKKKPPWWTEPEEKRKLYWHKACEPVVVTIDGHAGTMFQALIFEYVDVLRPMDDKCIATVYWFDRGVRTADDSWISNTPIADKNTDRLTCDPERWAVYAEAFISGEWWSP